MDQSILSQTTRYGYPAAIERRGKIFCFKAFAKLGSWYFQGKIINLTCREDLLRLIRYIESDMHDGAAVCNVAAETEIVEYEDAAVLYAWFDK